MDEPFAAVWSLPALELLQRLRTEPKGLTDEEARKRLGQFGRNLLYSAILSAAGAEVRHVQP